jgi:RNA polymerase sigma-70 factor (ECF subfamily)
MVLPTNKKMPSGQVSDEILAARVAQGDRTALETLYDHHAAAVLGLSLKIIGDRATAAGVLQETFWRVWQSAGTYQPQRESFTRWLFRIARDIANDAYRRQSARPQTITEMANANPILDEIPDSDMEVGEQAQSNLNTQKVRNILTVLSRDQRQVIEMAYFRGMTRQEIAEATGEALETIQTRARLGLQKLHKELERRTEFEG